MTDKKNNSLRRSLNLPMITFYGLGNILGAGIYVLVGKVAGAAGYYVPLAFLLASVIAAISAFSYAELSARHPVSAGVAAYIYEGFHIRRLSLLVGLMITMAGIVSAAAIAQGFAGYLRVFFDIPEWLIVSTLIMSLAALAAWGIQHSVLVATLFTLIEMAGLLLIVVVGLEHIPEITAVPPPTSALSTFSLVGVLSGAFLAFYAYLGFEDMVNISEEVKNPTVNMPRAILLAVIISTLLYTAVVMVAVITVPPSLLADSKAPLATVYTAATGRPAVVISIIGMFAVVNGALIQMIMASRLLYGMADKTWMPSWLAVVNPRTQTPVNSTLVVMMLMLLFALLLPLVTLAELTSYLVLMVFSLVNLALIKIKTRHPKPEGVHVYTLWVPRLGFITAFSFLLIKLLTEA